MLRSSSTPRKQTTPRKQINSNGKRKTGPSPSPSRRNALDVSPSKLARGSNSANSTPGGTPSKALALDGLDAALNHYFSPKRKASRSPSRRTAAQKRLEFAPVDAVDTDGASTDSGNEENVAPTAQLSANGGREKISMQVKCDLEELTRCFHVIDDYLPDECARREANLSENFDYWKRLLETGRFSLLLHGLGSKRVLLNRFASETLTDTMYAVFHCYRPGVTCRNIFDVLNSEFELNVKHRGLSLIDWAAKLRAAIENSRMELFLLIHNIDAPCMRDAQQQRALSILAQSTSIRLIATIDHKNATLLWDLETRERFNWLLERASTFRSHADLLVETSELRSLGLNVRQGGRQHNAASLDVFWQATTPNMRKILQQLAVYAGSALSRTAKDDVEPLTLSTLCHILKQEFATNSEAVLRTQLGEFVDSNIIRLDKDDTILLNVDRNVLVQFLETKSA